MAKGIDKYLWENMDATSKKFSRKQWREGKPLDCLTWNLDVFLAKIISEYLQHYLDKASNYIEITKEERDDIEFVIKFFKDYQENKYDIGRPLEDNYESNAKKAFELLNKRFCGLWW